MNRIHGTPAYVNLLFFVSEILSIDDLPPAITLLENICAYPWHVETKYYTADVSLCTSDVRTIGNVSFANCVQAFVAVFDTTQASFSCFSKYIFFGISNVIINHLLALLRFDAKR